MLKWCFFLKKNIQHMQKNKYQYNEYLSNNNHIICPPTSVYIINPYNNNNNNKPKKETLMIVTDRLLAQSKQTIRFYDPYLRLHLRSKFNAILEASPSLYSSYGALLGAVDVFAYVDGIAKRGGSDKVELRSREILASLPYYPAGTLTTHLAAFASLLSQPQLKPLTTQMGYITEPFIEQHLLPFMHNQAQNYHYNYSNIFGCNDGDAKQNHWQKGLGWFDQVLCLETLAWFGGVVVSKLPPGYLQKYNIVRKVMYINDIILHIPIKNKEINKQIIDNQPNKSNNFNQQNKSAADIKICIIGLTLANVIMGIKLSKLGYWVRIMDRNSQTLQKWAQGQIPDILKQGVYQCPELHEKKFGKLLQQYIGLSTQSLSSRPSRPTSQSILPHKQEGSSRNTSKREQISNDPLTRYERMLMPVLDEILDEFPNNGGKLVFQEMYSKVTNLSADGRDYGTNSDNYKKYGRNISRVDMQCIKVYLDRFLVINKMKDINNLTVSQLHKHICEYYTIPHALNPTNPLTSGPAPKSKLKMLLKNMLCFIKFQKMKVSKFREIFGVEQQVQRGESQRSKSSDYFYYSNQSSRQRKEAQKEGGSDIGGLFGVYFSRYVDGVEWKESTQLWEVTTMNTKTKEKETSQYSILIYSDIESIQKSIKQHSYQIPQIKNCPKLPLLQQLTPQSQIHCLYRFREKVEFTTISSGSSSSRSQYGSVYSYCPSEFGIIHFFMLGCGGDSDEMGEEEVYEVLAQVRVQKSQQMDYYKQIYKILTTQILKNPPKPQKQPLYPIETCQYFDLGSPNLLQKITKPVMNVQNLYISVPIVTPSSPLSSNIVHIQMAINNKIVIDIFQRRQMLWGCRDEHGQKEGDALGTMHNQNVEDLDRMNGRPNVSITNQPQLRDIITYKKSKPNQQIQIISSSQELKGPSNNNQQQYSIVRSKQSNIPQPVRASVKATGVKETSQMIEQNNKISSLFGMNSRICKQLCTMLLKSTKRVYSITHSFLSAIDTDPDIQQPNEALNMINCYNNFSQLLPIVGNSGFFDNLYLINLGLPSLLFFQTMNQQKGKNYQQSIGDAMLRNFATVRLAKTLTQIPQKQNKQAQSLMQQQRQRQQKANIQIIKKRNESCLYQTTVEIDHEIVYCIVEILREQTQSNIIETKSKYKSKDREKDRNKQKYKNISWLMLYHSNITLFDQLLTQFYGPDHQLFQQSSQYAQNDKSYTYSQNSKLECCYILPHLIQTQILNQISRYKNRNNKSQRLRVNQQQQQSIPHGQQLYNQILQQKLTQLKQTCRQLHQYIQKPIQLQNITISKHKTSILAKLITNFTLDIPTTVNYIYKQLESQVEYHCRLMKLRDYKLVDLFFGRLSPGFVGLELEVAGWGWLDEGDEDWEAAGSDNDGVYQEVKLYLKQLSQKQKLSKYPLIVLTQAPPTPTPMPATHSHNFNFNYNYNNYAYQNPKSLKSQNSSYLETGINNSNTNNNYNTSNITNNNSSNYNTISIKRRFISVNSEGYLQYKYFDYVVEDLGDVMGAPGGRGAGRWQRDGTGKNNRNEKGSNGIELQKCIKNVIDNLVVNNYPVKNIIYEFSQLIKQQMTFMFQMMSCSNSSRIGNRQMSTLLGEPSLACKRNLAIYVKMTRMQNSYSNHNQDEGNFKQVGQPSCQNMPNFGQFAEYINQGRLIYCGKDFIFQL